VLINTTELLNHKVPVGDIRSSDPYCILHIGPNRVGQTTVRTWTLIPLLHLKHPLVIEIWDFDSVGSDDILGKVELNLGDLPSNCKVEHKLNLERASDTINPRGVLYLDAFLEVPFCNEYMYPLLFFNCPHSFDHFP